VSHKWSLAGSYVRPGPCDPASPAHAVKHHTQHPQGSSATQLLEWLLQWRAPKGQQNMKALLELAHCRFPSTMAGASGKQRAHV